MAHRGRFPADDALAVGLARGLTLKDAAAGAGVSVRTANRRNANPIFRALVKDLRAGMVSDACGVMAHGMTAAARVLVELLADEDAHVRHKAAVSLLTVGAKLRETVEFDERLNALEHRDDDTDEDSEPRGRLYLPVQVPVPDDDEDDGPNRGLPVVRVVETVVPCRGGTNDAAAG